MTEQSTTLAAPAHAERTGAPDEGAGTPPGPLAERAGALAALAAGHASRGEEERGLTEEVVAGIVAAGFARHFVPAAHGGAEGGFGELAEAVLRLGTGCTSAAWAASLSAYAGRYAAYLPEEGQAEVWAEGPDALLAGALVPSGTVTPVPGGWRLDGAWPYISGVRHAAWVLACATVPGGGDEEGPEVRFFAVPRAAHRVERTWNTTGMRATGSDTLVLDDVLVPAHRSFPRTRVLAGHAPASRARCHTVRMARVGALPFVTPLVGAARGALRAWTERAARGRAPSPGALGELSRAAGETDAAELLVLRAAAAADGTVSLPEPAAAVRGKRDTALAAELVVGAVQRLVRASGTSGQSPHDPVQRFWRDVQTGASHVALSPEAAGAAYGAWAMQEAKR
ncbi:two-component flavin-dependent monooxygenase [Streptomyces sp. TverLS-915]|uniref:hydrolase n=1 Tax=Streptomyces sp. TverLS-915 TaxID=1839763 RepID=UPI00081DB52C|nr:hydrolase [Streptomyces sp. TverLS-915]SCD48350.1 two-component flavin-dependent monooxygenase [Streptomyces sp. TverLS-915]